MLRDKLGVSQQVAPFTGAWIEISYATGWPYGKNVAPFTGAWIEIVEHARSYPLPLVAPFTGAWIEMTITPLQ